LSPTTEKGEIDTATGAAMIQEADERAVRVKKLLEIGWTVIPGDKEANGL